MSEFDKELEQLAQKFFNASTGGAYSVDIPKTIEYKDFEKAIKQAVDKYVIGEDAKSVVGLEMPGNAINLRLAKQRESLWGAK